MDTIDGVFFSDIAIVSYETLRRELSHLRESCFLDARPIFYTTPGLHEDAQELENLLIQCIKKPGTRPRR